MKKKYPSGKQYGKPRQMNKARQTLFLKKLKPPQSKAAHLVWFSSRNGTVYAGVKNEIPFSNLEDMKPGEFATLSADTEAEIYSGNPNISFYRLSKISLKKITDAQGQVLFDHMNVDATESGSRKTKGVNMATTGFQTVPAPVVGMTALEEFLNQYADPFGKK